MLTMFLDRVNSTDRQSASLTAFEVALEQDRQLRLALSGFAFSGDNEPARQSFPFLLIDSHSGSSNTVVRLASLPAEMFSRHAEAAVWFESAAKRLASFLLRASRKFVRTDGQRDVSDRAVSR